MLLSLCAGISGRKLHDFPTLLFKNVKEGGLDISVTIKKSQITFVGFKTPKDGSIRGGITRLGACL
jgi:hypothetical protein